MIMKIVKKIKDNIFIYCKLNLDDYTKIPITFEVNSIFEVCEKDGDMSGYELTEVPVDTPYIKDYDDNGKHGPLTWEGKYDTSNWAFFLIYDGKTPIAGATAVYNSPEINMLEGRGDLTVLWDIRIHPDYRGRGIGRELIEAVMDWAKQRHCTQLKIETQNVNVNACRFYKAMGAKLRKVNYHVYKDKEKEEIQFLWYIDL